SHDGPGALTTWRNPGRMTQMGTPPARWPIFAGAIVYGSSFTGQFGHSGCSDRSHYVSRSHRCRWDRWGARMEIFTASDGFGNVGRVNIRRTGAMTAIGSM